MCNTCNDTQQIIAEPSVVGWVFIEDRTYRTTEGKTYTFTEGEEDLLLCVCPDCYPSSWGHIITIN